ncbi:MAG TPA: hypothetical protein DGB72_09895 [Gemmatimonadetes bacterium]|nr:hypothetical protein [Gemmatimonadota bacterium]
MNAPIFLAMMYRYADGTLTLAFWYAATLSTLMIGAGVWGLVAPESFRVFYFKLYHRLPLTFGPRFGSERPTTGWGWGSPTSIRLSSVLAIAIAGTFMAWVAFFTRPGVTY